MKSISECRYLTGDGRRFLLLLTSHSELLVSVTFVLYRGHLEHSLSFALLASVFPTYTLVQSK